jgi:hypothetical protein
MCTTRDKKIVSAMVKDIMKPRVVDYNTQMGEVNLSDAYPVNYRSISK